MNSCKVFNKPNNYCSNWATQGKLPEWNNVIALRMMVKSNEGLKGTEPFTQQCYTKRLKIYQSLKEKTHDVVLLV